MATVLAETCRVHTQFGWQYQIKLHALLNFPDQCQIVSIFEHVGTLALSSILCLSG
jgi:hypothetical protein